MHAVVQKLLVSHNTPLVTSGWKYCPVNTVYWNPLYILLPHRAIVFSYFIPLYVLCILLLLLALSFRAWGPCMWDGVYAP